MVKPWFPKLSDIPEAARKDYKELPDGGGWLLVIDEDGSGYGIDKLAPLRGKLDEAVRDADRQKKHLQGFAKPDGSLYTGDEVKEIVKKHQETEALVETLKSKDKSSETKLQEMVAAAKRPLETDLRKQTERATKLVEKAKRSAIREARDAALAKLDPYPEWRDDLAASIERRLEAVVNDETGDITVRVIDPESRQPRFSSRPGNDGPMTPIELAETDIKRTFGKYLKGDGKKGADLGPSHKKDTGHPTPPPGGGNGEPYSGPGRAHGKNIYLDRKTAEDINAYAAADKAARAMGGEAVIGSPEAEAALDAGTPE